MNRNYQKELDEIIEKEEKKNIVSKILLHSCCAPCSSYVLAYLSLYFEITVLYYNPNIYPDEEYQKRVQEQKKFIKEMKVKHPVNFIEGNFDKVKFYEKIKGYEDCPEGQERCFICYHLRLAETAKIAKEQSADYFTTTLSISPMKNANKLNEIGEDIAGKVGVRWLPSDFKKRNGYKRSVELAAEYGLYRQDYCGCTFSRR